MLLVKTKLGVSSVHGIGLFAAQFIPKGTATWEYHPDFDTSFGEDDLARMPPPPQRPNSEVRLFRQRAWAICALFR